MSVTNPFLSFQPGGMLDYLNGDPNAGYGRFLGQQGVRPGDSNPFARWARASQSNLYQDYQSQLPDKPDYLWTDYLNKFDLKGQFNQMAPRERGDRMGSGSGAVKYNMPF